MILAIDTSALALLINPQSLPPNDPSTDAPTERVTERVEHLLSSLTPADTIIVPTPVLAELLVKAEDGAPELLATLQTFARIRIRPFDERAAVEHAMMTREAIAAGAKRGSSGESWSKVKFDRQIIAVARVHGATKVYADDQNLAAFARILGLSVVSTWELPFPEAEADLFTQAGIVPGPAGEPA